MRNSAQISCKGTKQISYTGEIQWIKLKNTIESVNNRLDQAEENISELKGKSFEITHQTKKKNTRKWISLHDIGDRIKQTNIHTLEIPEEKDMGAGTENLLNEIMAENFPCLRRELDIQI